jgi:LacI family transcriptional regulator
MNSWVDSGVWSNQMGNITLADVAKLAEVSISTASKALNNRSDVHQATRAKVLEAAATLNFRPDLLADRFISAKTGTVGLLTDDLVGRFSLPILTGAESALGFQKISVFLCDARGDDFRESFHINALLQKRIDGLIVVGSSSNARKSLGRDFPVPVVYAYVPSTDNRDLSIIPDNEGSAELIAEHLISIGKKKIAHIAGRADSNATQLRVKGFQNALAKHGLKLAAKDPIYGDWLESWGRTATLALLSNKIDFDAVFCGNDQIARGVVETLRENDLSVPTDVAVVGFDNWDVVVTGCKPQLTSLDMNLEELGAKAAQRLFEAIYGQKRTGAEKILGKLILRGSTMNI